jgi:hypothetical protein
VHHIEDGLTLAHWSANPAPHDCRAGRYAHSHGLVLRNARKSTTGAIGSRKRPSLSFKTALMPTLSMEATADGRDVSNRWSAP